MYRLVWATRFSGIRGVPCTISSRKYVENSTVHLKTIEGNNRIQKTCCHHTYDGFMERGHSKDFRHIY